MVLFLILALLCGVALVTQPGINGVMSSNVGGTLNATTISLCVSATSILVLRLFLAPSMPSTMIAFDKVPVWAWTGGFFGVFYVGASMFLAPRIGATALVAAILCGQLVAALAYDKFGILGYGAIPITPARVIGITLIIAGTALVFLRR